MESTAFWPMFKRESSTAGHWGRFSAQRSGRRGCRHPRRLFPHFSGIDPFFD